MLKPFGLSRFRRMKIKSFAICPALCDQASVKTPFPHSLLRRLGSSNSALLPFFGWAVILPATGPLHMLLLCLRSSPRHILLVRASYSSNSLSIASLGKAFSACQEESGSSCHWHQYEGLLASPPRLRFHTRGFLPGCCPSPPLACMT